MRRLSRHLAIAVAFGVLPLLVAVPAAAAAGGSQVSTIRQALAPKGQAEPPNPRMRIAGRGAASGAARPSVPQLTLSAPACNSSWTAVTSPNSGTGLNELNGIAAAAANDGWAVGDYRDSAGVDRALAEHWNGTAWNIVATPNVGAGDNVFASIASVGSNDVWAVGFSRADNNSPRQSLTEHWNGSSWTVVASPQLANTTNSLFGVGADASNDVWAVGRSLTYPETNLGPRGQTLVMHWNGSAWSVVATPATMGSTGAFDTSELSAVKVLAGNDAWAVGDVADFTGSSMTLGPLALIEHWNGTGWAQVAAAPDNPSGDFLSDIGGKANDLWTVGGQTSSSTTDNVLTEHWNGTSWTAVSAVTPDLSANLIGVGYLASNNVYAVGASAYQGPSTSSELDHTLIEQWNGTSWAQVTSANASADNDLFAIASISAHDVWAAGFMNVNGVGKTLTENLCAPPVVNSISPASGPDPGGTSVVITGSNLSGAVEVDFGGTAASSFHVDSDTQITATSPAHAPGTVDVTVRVQGTSATSSADQFTFLAVAPAAPTNVVAIAGEASATVYWAPPASDGGAALTSYTVTPYLGAVAQTPTVVSGSPPPTTARVFGLTDGLGYTFNVAATNSAGTGPGTASNPVTPGRGQYHALTPARILDTRSGLGAPQARLGAAARLDVQIAGQGGVPANGAAAVVLNVTATNTTAGSYLTVWPAGVPRPLASNLNWTAGKTVPNLVEVALGVDGKVSVFNAAGNSDVVFDVAGYVATPTATPGPDGLLTPVVPNRVLDTRNGTGGVPAAPVGAGQTIMVRVAGTPNIPSTGVAAVVLNVTVTGPTAPGYLTVWPSGIARPVVSNLNFVAGQTVPNRVIVRVGSNGSTAGWVSFFNPGGSVHVIADVSGWFSDGSNAAATGSRFVGLTPARILDTRDGTGGVSSPIGAGQTLALMVAGQGGVPAMNAAIAPTAVVLNVTVTGTTAASFLTVWPSDATRPTASDLNWTAGLTVPNLVVVKLGSDGKIKLYNPGGSTNVVIDVVGWDG